MINLPPLPRLNIGQTCAVPPIGRESRYVMPRPSHDVSDKYITYRSAEKLAKELSPYSGGDVFAVLSGAFIFGDFIEAWTISNGWALKSLRIVTLGYSQDNVDSLANLAQGDRLYRLSLICGDRFWHEERSRLVKYAYEKLDIPEKCHFQLAACGTHMKYCLLETWDGTRSRKIVIHGSSNLRTCANLEQIHITESDQVFDFFAQIHDTIEADYKTIRHAIQKPARVDTLWGVLGGDGEYQPRQDRS